ncbi:MAG: SDR family oxidoreductase [Micromonosporaceae bacterium]
MILVAGGTGTLGTKVVSLLADRGAHVRVLTRDHSRAHHLGARVEIVEGDVRNPATLQRAADGAQIVISAIQGFAGAPDCTPASVDRDGNVNLIRAAQDAGTSHLILVSVRDASPSHPMELMRMKHAAEQQLKGSGLAWTIIRPSAYMETWCRVLGRPLLDKGRTMVFGRGANPINWVCAWDVARFVDLAAADPAIRGRTIDVGGPENLTMTEFVRTFQNETGANGRIGHLPRPLMRLGSIAAKPIKPAIARQIQAGVVMDTMPQAFDASATRRRYPSIPATNLAAAIRQEFAASGDVVPAAGDR